MADNTTPTPIVDKNGKRTTVHKKVGDTSTGKNRVSAVSQPKKSIAAEEAELLSDLNENIDSVESRMSELDAQSTKIADERKALYKQYDDFITMKLELEADKYSADSPIEELKDLNNLARRNRLASEIEQKWVSGVHKKFRVDTYDMEHQLPIATLSFDHKEPIDDELVEGMLTFARTVADGREEVKFSLLTGNNDSSWYDLEVNAEDGTAAVIQSSRRNYYRFGDESKPLKEALEWVSKNLPLTARNGNLRDVYFDDEND